MMFTQDQRQKIIDAMSRILNRMWGMKYEERKLFISIGNSTEMADEIIKTLEPMQPMKAFSESISAPDGACPACGKRNNLYFKPFDKTLFPLLETFYYAGKPLKNSELADAYIEAAKTNRVTYWSKKKSGYAPSLRWWGLIRKVDQDIERNARYEITELGKKCIEDHSTMIPDHVWTHRDGKKTHAVSAPAGTEHTHPIRMISIQEIIDSPRRSPSKQELVEKSIPHSS